MTAHISNWSLMLASSLVLVSLAFSYRQSLQLEKDIFVSAIRAVVQLIVIGYMLQYIFGSQSHLFTIGLLLIMLYNTAYHTGKRGKGVPRAQRVSFIGIGIGTVLTLAVLLVSGALSFEAYQMIPVGGMVMSGAMVASGLCFKQLVSHFHIRQQEVEVKLALGASVKQATQDILRDAVKTGMQPTIDSAKTLGIVSLPGMMTGLILAGVDPLDAVKYQIIVTFMNLSGTAIASFIACYLG